MTSPEEPALRFYSSQDLRHGMEALADAMAGLSTHISQLRQDVAELRSDLRSVNEQNRRQDVEIWAADGLSRLSAVQSDSQRQAMQIKGLWTAITALIGFVCSYAIGHLR